MSEKANDNKPGQGALKAMANLDKSEIVFKKPLTASVKKNPKRRKIKVLDEDTYIEVITLTNY